ncbi:MAG: ribonuclease P protein component [Hyphomicrobiaceae bacterium]|nr:ribonuclease P protein component [Hyphomicrobiaceae bacterium]
MPLLTLKRRREFLRIRGGSRWATPAFVLEAKLREPAHTTAQSANVVPAQQDSAAARFGFTITKKLGNAVVRNRIRRRLKDAFLRHVDQAAAGCDYVVVARAAALDRSFSLVLADVATALERVGRHLASSSSRRREDGVAASRDSPNAVSRNGGTARSGTGRSKP